MYTSVCGLVTIITMVIIVYISLVDTVPRLLSVNKTDVFLQKACSYDFPLAFASYFKSYYSTDLEIFFISMYVIKAHFCLLYAKLTYQLTLVSTWLILLIWNVTM